MRLGTDRLRTRPEGYVQTRPLLEEIRSRCHPHVASDVLAWRDESLPGQSCGGCHPPMLAKVGPDGGLPVATQCPLRDRLFAIFKLIGVGMTQRGDVRRHTPLSAMQPGISRQVPRILLGHPQQSFLLAPCNADRHHPLTWLEVCQLFFVEPFHERLGPKRGFFWFFVFLLVFFLTEGPPGPGGSACCAPRAPPPPPSR